MVESGRRRSDLTTPIPKARATRGAGALNPQQRDFLQEEGGQEYNPTETINGIRSAVESWRALPESQWQVTPTTARLLRHWRTHDFANQRPFFCQIEAVETVVWLTEVAPRSSPQGRRFWTHLEAANAASNPELIRLALKLATGAGKATVMAMLIAWHTLNAVRHPNAKKFTKGFLVVAPGITIKDRLRVLQPNDPESYYCSREIVPEDMLRDLGQAKIVITNYHAFKKKDEVSLNKVQQAALATTTRPESDGAMLRRVAGALMGMKNIVVLNDEAHHCYRERPLTAEEEKSLKGDEKAEAKENNEAARLWISGLEAVKRTLSLLEPATARKYFDPCLLGKVDLSHVNWICTANSIDGIPAALQSRSRVVQVEGPRGEHLDALIASTIGPAAELIAQEQPTTWRRLHAQLTELLDRARSARAVTTHLRALASAMPRRTMH